MLVSHSLSNSSLNNAENTTVSPSWVLTNHADSAQKATKLLSLSQHSYNWNNHLEGKMARLLIA